MACPDAVPVPGNSSSSPAAWNDRMALVVPTGAGYPDYAQLTVTVKSGGSAPRPVEIEAASPQTLALVLPGPPAGADAQGPHSLIVEGPVSGTCTVDLDVRGAALPAEPTDEDLKAVLEYLAAGLDLVLSGLTVETKDGLPLVAPGGATQASIVNFPPFVTPAGTTVPMARSRDTGRGLRGIGRTRVGDVLGGVLGGSVLGGVLHEVAEGPPTSPPGTVPIRPTIEWTLVREDGKQLVQGEDYLVSSLGAGLAAFRIVPPISKSKAAPPQKVSVKATGTLKAYGSAIGRSDVSVPIPELADDLLLESLALPVPFFAGFRLEKFAPANGDGALGAVYVQVPPGWADAGVEGLMTAMDEARELLRPLDRIAFIAELLLGLRTLSRVLSAQHSFVAEKALVVEDLYRYRWFKHDHWYGWDSWFEDLYVEDRISSFIALGLADQAVQCYSAKNNDSAQEWLEVRFTDPIGMAVVERLRTKSPASTLARGAMVTPKVLPKDADDLYDESFSSITLVEG